MADLKPTVLVEDNPKDLELTLIALERARWANEVITLRDGAEAIDYLSCKGEWAHQEKGNPGVISAGHQTAEASRESICCQAGEFHRLCRGRAGSGRIPGRSE